MTTEPQRAPAGLEARPPSPNGHQPRSPAQIEADIEATRVHMAATVDAIADRVSPKNVLHRTIDAIKAQFVNPDGSPRVERVAAAGLGVAAVVGLLVWKKAR